MKTLDKILESLLDDDFDVTDRDISSTYINSIAELLDNYENYSAEQWKTIVTQI